MLCLLTLIRVCDYVRIALTMTKGKKYTHQTPKKKQNATKTCDHEEEEDTEMQISNKKPAPPIVSTESGNKTVQIDPLSCIPSVATIRKECDGSISTELTMNKTDTSSSHVVCSVNIQVDGKPKAVGNKTLKFEIDKPIDELTEIETDAVIRAIMEFIYPTCWYVAHADHMDSVTCFIFGKIGYARPEQGHGRTKRWACTRQLIMDTINSLCNGTMDRYRSLGKGIVLFLSSCSYEY